MEAIIGVKMLSNIFLLTDLYAPTEKSSTSWFSWI